MAFRFSLNSKSLAPFPPADCQRSAMTPRITIYLWLIWCAGVAITLATKGPVTFSYVPLMILEAACVAAVFALIRFSPGLPLFARISPGHVLCAIFASRLIWNTFLPYPLIGPRAIVPGFNVAAATSIVIACQVPLTKFRVYGVPPFMRRFCCNSSHTQAFSPLSHIPILFLQQPSVRC